MTAILNSTMNTSAAVPQDFPALPAMQILAPEYFHARVRRVYSSAREALFGDIKALVTKTEQLFVLCSRHKQAEHLRREHACASVSFFDLASRRNSDRVHARAR